MSGDVQPRKRKEKRRKKDSEEIPASFASDEQLHVHKDASTGGNICAKILFFLLSFVLLVMIGLVVFEYRGSTDDETLVPVSKWAATFEGWLETPVTHDEHADVTESGEKEHGESGEHENESAEGEEHLSEEAGSKEEDEDEDEEEDEEEEEHLSEEAGSKEEDEEEEEEEQIGSEEEETKSAEEEEDEDEEADKLDDEESEEVDENEIDDTAEDDDQDYDEHEKDEEEEESEEDVYEHDKSDEDVDTEKEDDDDREEDDEEDDVEAGREELDDEEETPAYHRESNEIDDVLNEIPGITESDEDEEGDNLGRSDEILDKLPKIPGVDVKKIKAVSEEEADVPKRKQEKEDGGEMKSSRLSQDKTAEEKEEEEEGEDEPEPSGVALKFGVGVALVIVAHVVLVKKWNSDENLAASNTSDAPQSVPQVQQRKISEQIPQILVEPETEKDSEESSYLSSEYITRRQTLLPDDLVQNSPQRELEDSESSVPSEEESDDDQEEFIFKQNVYKAENAFKASHRDEKPFLEEKPYKQQSFEELMKKYHEHTPEGSDIESDEDEQGEEEEEEEDDERDIEEEEEEEDDDDELIDDEDEHEKEQEEAEISEHKGQGSKISATPDTEGTSPRKFVVDTPKEQRIAPVEQKTGNRGEDETLVGGKEDEEHEEEDTGELYSEDDSLGEKLKNYQLPKTRKLQRDEEDDESGSDKEIPVTKSKIPKNMGGQNAQVYSKADITNEDDWHILQDLDRADDDADEDLNF